jgi:hypothetical protein
MITFPKAGFGRSGRCTQGRVGFIGLGSDGPTSHLCWLTSGTVHSGRTISRCAKILLGLDQRGLPFVTAATSCHGRSQNATRSIRLAQDFQRGGRSCRRNGSARRFVPTHRRHGVYKSIPAAMHERLRTSRTIAASRLAASPRQFAVPRLRRRRRCYERWINPTAHGESVLSRRPH